MSEILSRAQTEQMNIAFAKGWRGPYGTPCGMEADMSRLLDSHEALREKAHYLLNLVERAAGMVYSYRSYAEQHSEFADVDADEASQWLKDADALMEASDE